MDLALVLAKRQLSMSWKNSRGPGVARWEADVKAWAQAEEQALRREEARGLRRTPIAPQCAEVVEAFMHLEQESDRSTDVSVSPGRGST